LEGCVKLANIPWPSKLDPVHLENISALYVPESLKIGQVEYETEINNNLFETLLHEAGKQEFNDENIFNLFDSILNLKEKYAARILEILVVYASKHVVPEATVATLENMLSVSSYFEKAFMSLQNIIHCGKSLVTSKTLNVFVDYLYSSSNKCWRYCSFKLLEQVSRNQELDDGVFCKFELAKAGYALECHTELAYAAERQLIIEFIQTKTNKGMQLPVDTQIALEELISCKGVLKIFANISENKQIIPLNLLHKLIEMFEPTENKVSVDKIFMISIFENAAKNNQTLPRKLLSKLEEALRRKDLEQSVLPVYIYLAQKGEKLSKDVNDKLLERLVCEQDPVLKQELLSSLGSIIDSNQQEIKVYQIKINQILINEIKSNNFNIQKLCVAVICKLVTVSKQISDELLHELVAISTNLNCNKTIKNDISAFVESIEDDCNALLLKNCYRHKIQLANLDCKSIEELLNCLNLYTYLEDGFLEQNYKQLKDVIDKGSLEQQEGALNIFHESRCKSKIPDELLESVAALFEYTMLKRIKSSCMNLFQEAVDSGRTIKGRAREIWCENVNRDNNLEKFIQSQVYEEIKRELGFPAINPILDSLKLIQESEKISGVKSLADLMQLIVKENCAFYESQSFVLLIEECLLKKTILRTTLPCYCRMIQERKCGKVKECLQILAEHFSESEQDMIEKDHLLYQFFELMYYAGKFAQLPSVCLKLAVKHDNISITAVKLLEDIHLKF